VAGNLPHEVVDCLLNKTVGSWPA